MTSSDPPEAWLERYGTALYRYALTHVRDHHKAEDLVQETLLAALDARDRFAGNASVRTWLTAILKHKLMDQFRREAREVRLDVPDRSGEGDDRLMEEIFDPSGAWRDRGTHWGDPERLLEDEAFIAALQQCIDALPERSRRLYWLREVFEEDTSAICKELAITPSNLWTMLHRVRLTLRRCLDGSWHDHDRGRRC